jgi:hypothetical protein
MADQDPLLGGISPDTTQQVLAMVLAQLAGQKKQPDPVADYLEEMKRQDEERKKQEQRNQRMQSMNSPQNSSYGGGQSRSGASNVMGALNMANDVSKLYNNESLISNIGSIASK